MLEHWLIELVGHVSGLSEAQLKQIEKSLPATKALIDLLNRARPIIEQAQSLYAEAEPLIDQAKKEWQTVGPAAQILIDVISHHVNRGSCPGRGRRNSAHRAQWVNQERRTGSFDGSRNELRNSVWRDRLCRSSRRALFARGRHQGAHSLAASGARRDDGIEQIAADAHDERCVEAALADADGAVNAISLYVEHGSDTFHSVHVEAAGKIARAARQAGIQRFVHISGIGANTASPSTYIRSRGEGEAAVQTAFPGAVIVRPAVMFAADDAFLTTILRLLRSLPAYPIFGDGRTRLQPVHADNVAAATFLVYMLSPLPRHSGWAYYFARPPSRVSLPRYGSRVGLRIVLFEACSAFTRVTACTLALSPYIVTP